MSLTSKILDAYYTALNGNVTGMDVYKLTVPETETGNYVVLSLEGGSDDDNKSSHVERIIVRVDVVVKYMNDASQTLVDEADSQIKDIICPNPGGNGLTGDGVDIRNVTRENYVYVMEQGQSDLTYRKVSRYTQRVIS